MANLIVVCGPQAVGKMTVAESLRDKLYRQLRNADPADDASAVPLYQSVPLACS